MGSFYLGRLTPEIEPEGSLRGAAGQATLLPSK